DPDPAGEEDVRDVGLLRKHEAALRLLHLDLRTHRQRDQRALEGAVSQPGAEPEDSALAGRGDDGDVAARAFLVVERRGGGGAPERLARAGEARLPPPGADDEERAPPPPPRFPLPPPPSRSPAAR